MPTPADPCVIIIFGASGDLTARKIIPALFTMAQRGDLPKQTRILGVSRSDMTDDAFRDSLEPWARKAEEGEFDASAWKTFAQRITYFAGDATQQSMYPALAGKVCELAKNAGMRENVLVYLSVKPSLYEPIIGRIEQSGMVTEGKRWCSLNPESAAWQRIVVEKPIGRDLASAQSLNRALGRVFEEEAIFRIDHYLGKELVQNLLVFRFANAIFEPVWNHRYVDSVQITAIESVGAGHRASFYDETGAVRDMIQSHLLQILALVAMEPPTNFSPNHIRQEKIKVIDAIRPFTAATLAESAVYGQYAGDAEEPAYHEAEGVSPANGTETFAAVKFQFDNWRWAGTPFYVRTGKRLAMKRTEIVVDFKRPPADLFRLLGSTESLSQRPPNRIIIEIAPRPGVHLRFEGKVPGLGMKIDSVWMDFDFVESFNAEPVEAYGPLILDAMRGDQTLYPHRLEVEGGWRAVAPLIGKESNTLRKNIAANYAPGSWGPSAADEMLARHGRKWHNTSK